MTKYYHGRKLSPHEESRYEKHGSWDRLLTPYEKKNLKKGGRSETLTRLGCDEVLVALFHSWRNGHLSTKELEHFAKLVRQERKELPTVCNCEV